MVDKRQIINAVIGAVASFVLSFVPFSTVLGGGIAGYLQGSDRREGLTVGAMAGAIAMLPFAAVGLLILLLGGIGFASGGELAGIVVFLMFAAVVFVITLVYTVGLCALGGYIGAYLAPEYPDPRESILETIGMEEDDARANATGRGERGRVEPEGAAASAVADDEPTPGVESGVTDEASVAVDDTDETDADESDGDEVGEDEGDGGGIGEDESDTDEDGAADDGTDGVGPSETDQEE